MRRTAGPLGGLSLIVLALAVYLPGLTTLPPVDRDESRFAQASRQMFESLALDPALRDVAPLERTETGVRGGAHAGALAVPMVQDRPRLNKPPLVYWLQTLAAWVATGGQPAADAIWMYRLPSVVAAVVAVLATWRLGCSMIDPRAAWIGAALLAVCPMVVWDAHQARADQLLLACNTLTMWALWSIWSRRDRRPAGDSPRPLVRALRVVPLRAALFWCALALGMLAKGPITPMIALLTACWLSWIGRDWRWLRRLRPVAGLAIVGAMLLPWVALVASKVGLAWYLSIVFDETIGRSGSPREGHWGPPGYHLVLASVLFWPGSLLTLQAFVRTWRLAVRLPAGTARWWSLKGLLRELPRRWTQRVVGRDDELFLVAWIVPAWVVFELISTKLPHYTLPLYPALALMTAKTVWDGARGALDTMSASGARAGLNVWTGIGLLLCVVAPVGVALLGAGAVGLASAVLGGAGAAALIWLARGRLDQGFVLTAQLVSCGAALVLAGSLLGVVLPRADTLWISPRVVDALESVDRADAPLAAIGYQEDSLVFLRRGRVDKIGSQHLRAWLDRNPGGVVLAPRLIGEGDPDLRGLDAVSGLNYSSGRIMQLRLYERER